MLPAAFLVMSLLLVPPVLWARLRSPIATVRALRSRIGSMGGWLEQKQRAGCTDSYQRGPLKGTDQAGSRARTLAKARWTRSIAR